MRTSRSRTAPFTSARVIDSAGGEAFLPLPLAAYDDTVGRPVGLEPERLLGGGRVGHGGVDLDHFNVFERILSFQHVSSTARPQVGPQSGRHAGQ